MYRKPKFIIPRDHTRPFQKWEQHDIEYLQGLRRKLPRADISKEADLSAGGGEKVACPPCSLQPPV